MLLPTAYVHTHTHCCCFVDFRRSLHFVGSSSRLLSRCHAHTLSRLRNAKCEMRGRLPHHAHLTWGSQCRPIARKKSGSSARARAHAETTGQRPHEREGGIPAIFLFLGILTTRASQLAPELSSTRRQQKPSYPSLDGALRTLPYLSRAWSAWDSTVARA